MAILDLGRSSIAWSLYKDIEIRILLLEIDLLIKSFITCHNRQGLITEISYLEILWTIAVVARHHSKRSGTCGNLVALTTTTINLNLGSIICIVNGYPFRNINKLI